MSNGGLQLCLVVNSDCRLLGIITDSDIRKALLRGVTLDQNVTHVMNKAPLTTSPHVKEQEAKQIMKANHFFHLPIVDQDGIFTGIHITTQLTLPKDRDEHFIIMAGGRGKRLMPLTKSCPKPMLLINDIPILHHVIDRAKKDGFKNIVISVNYLSEQIIDYFGNGSDFGVNIKYLHEKEPLGTAGAIARIKSLKLESPFIVTNGDVLSDISYSDILNHSYKNKCDGIMSVRKHELQSPFGVVQANGLIFEGIEEKPSFVHNVNAGIYLIGSRLLELLNDDEYCDMTELFVKGHKKRLKLHVFPLHESWIDIGRKSDYIQAGGNVE